MSGKPVWEILREILSLNNLDHTDPTCFSTLLGELSDRGVDHYRAFWISDAYKMGVQDDMADNSVSNDTFTTVEARLVRKGIQQKVALAATNTWRKALGFSLSSSASNANTASRKRASIQRLGRTPNRLVGGVSHGRLLPLVLLGCFGLIGVFAINGAAKNKTQRVSADDPPKTKHQLDADAVPKHQPTPEHTHRLVRVRQPGRKEDLAKRTAERKTGQRATSHSKRYRSRNAGSSAKPIRPVQIVADTLMPKNTSTKPNLGARISTSVTESVAAPSLPTSLALSASIETSKFIRDLVSRYQPQKLEGGTDRNRSGRQATNPKQSRAFLAAELASRRGDHKKAITGFTSCIQAGEGSTWVYHGRAASRVHLMDYKGAKRDLDKAISLDNQNHLAFALRGLLKATIDEDFRSASKDLDHALNLNNRSPYVYFVRAAVFSRNGSPELLRRAAIECDLAIELAIELANKEERPSMLKPDAIYLKKLIDSDITQLAASSCGENRIEEFEEDPFGDDLDGDLFAEGDPFAEL